MHPRVLSFAMTSKNKKNHCHGNGQKPYLAILGQICSEISFKIPYIKHRRTGRRGVLVIATWAVWFWAAQGRLLTKKRKEKGERAALIFLPRPV